MNKMKMLKNIIMVIMGLAIMLAFTNVLAADNNTYQDLSQAIVGNNQAGNNASGGNLIANNSGTNNSNTNNGVFNTSGLTSNNSSNNSNSNSSYSNTTLPKTGAESVAPIVILVVIFGISAVYAYKKINEYKNV